ncbi:hypothetical protein FB451DRAFT_1191377 [Mycena latifolia]|nr:hypothetical protein FB451DRAFT_1191377 [Mycena latifolia]
MSRMILTRQKKTPAPMIGKARNKARIYFWLGGYLLIDSVIAVDGFGRPPLWQQGKGSGKPAATPTAKDFKGKQKANDEGSRFHAGYFDDDFLASNIDDDEDPFDRGMTPPPEPEPEPKIPKPTIPDSHKRLERLLKNMTAPNMVNKKPTTWWAATPISSFVAGIKGSDTCAAICNVYIQTPAHSVLAPASLLEFIQLNLNQPFADLVKLSNRLIGKADRLGSDGLYCPGTPEFEAEFDAQGCLLVSDVYDELVTLSYGLPRSLEHLRMKHSRSQWDPPGGYREFAIIRENKDAQLPVGTRESHEALGLKLLIDAINKPVPNIAQIGFLLIEAFGDDSNPKEMSQDRVVRGGEFGIGRIYDLVVVPILDTLDVNHVEYASMLTQVNTFFNGVARKLRNYLKASKSADPAPPLSTRSTRKLAKITTRNPPDWPFDCDATAKSKNRPKPKSKGKRRARSPSPIVISSSESDRQWRRIYARFAKSRGDTKASEPGSSTAANTAPNPAPQTRSQTRARPVWLDSDARPEDDLEDARTLPRRTRYWQDLMRHILERFPHPDPTRRITMDALLLPGVSRARQYHMLSLIYHVDRNVAQSAHFRAVAAIISQVLNDSRDSKFDEPKKAPPPKFSFTSR